MRIVHLLNHSRRANGHVEVAVDLACEQARHGHEVTLAAGPGGFTECLCGNGVRFVELTQRAGAVLSLFEMIATLRRLRPEIVHAHMVMSAMGARAAKPLSGFALITTVHNSFDRQSRLMGVGDLVIAVSHAVRLEMIGKGIAAEKLRVVHNGTINGSRRPPLPCQTMALQHPAIITVAGLHPRKGIDTLIQAFTKLRETGSVAHLYIVGVGPDRTKLEQLAASSGHADDIHFLGYLSDPRAAIAGADIFVLASLHEPCGLALIEARQMACACIATDVGGNPEILESGKAGLLIPPGNSDSLTDAMRSLIGDKSLHRTMRRAARAGWQHWTVERMAHETIRVYEEVRGVPSRPMPETMLQGT